MAVKIITEGEHPEDVRIQRNCTKCNSLLEFSRNDGKFISDQRDGDCVEILCPFCGNKLYVASREFKNDWAAGGR